MTHHADYSPFRRFETEEEARAASRGHTDFPSMQDWPAGDDAVSKAYRRGWSDAEHHHWGKDTE